MGANLSDPGTELLQMRPLTVYSGRSVNTHPRTAPLALLAVPVANLLPLNFRFTLYCLIIENTFRSFKYFCFSSWHEVQSTRGCCRQKGLFLTPVDAQREPGAHYTVHVHILQPRGVSRSAKHLQSPQHFLSLSLGIGGIVSREPKSVDLSCSPNFCCVYPFLYSGRLDIPEAGLPNLRDAQHIQSY